MTAPSHNQGVPHHDKAEASWYFVSRGETLGPVSIQEIEAAIAQGVLAPDALVWHQEMENWASAQMTELAPLFENISPGTDQQVTDIGDSPDPTIIKPKLEAFRNPDSPLAQAIAAGTASNRPSPPQTDIPPHPPSHGSLADSPKKTRLPIVMSLVLILLGAAALALWYFNISF